MYVTISFYKYLILFFLLCLFLKSFLILSFTEMIWAKQCFIIHLLSIEIFFKYQLSTTSWQLCQLVFQDYLATIYRLNLNLAWKSLCPSVIQTSRIFQWIYSVSNNISWAFRFYQIHKFFYLCFIDNSAKEIFWW